MRRALVLAAVLLAAACGPDTEEQRCGPSSDEVVSVVDGDTIALAGGEKVRYLMVDTPETTKGHNDCYGQEAKSFNTELVLGSRVDLKYDTECRDRYGRLLAYVSVDGREVNSLLVEQGFAKVLYIEPNGTDRVDEFRDLESSARDSDVGGWGTCPADDPWWN